MIVKWPLSSMPMGCRLAANFLDADGDGGCKRAAEWWPLGVQGATGRWAGAV